MTSKSSLPPGAEEVSRAPLGANNLPNRPEFNSVAPSKRPRRIALLLALLLVLILVATAGSGGYRYYLAHYTKNTTVTPATQTKATDSYFGWKTYMSSYENLSFKYPPNWNIKTSSDSTQVTGADSAVLTSPSGTIKIVWYSAVEGIGGACSTYIMPGTTPKPDDLSPCPYWYVLDKQQLAGAGLYYVDGIEEQSDGKGYIPWCGLQAPSGIIQNESNIGYMLFQSRSNHLKGSDGQDLGPVQVEFACGNNFNGTIPTNGTTKEAATAFLSSSEMQQAKLILTSAAYSVVPQDVWLDEHAIRVAVPNNWVALDANKSATFPCGQAVTSHSAPCIDRTVLILKNEGFTNYDQFYVGVSEFSNNKSLDAQQWFETLGLEGLGGQGSTVTINGQPAYRYIASPEPGNPNRVDLYYAIVNEGLKAVLVHTELFNGNHYSYKTTNNYLGYESDVDAIAKGVTILH